MKNNSKLERILFERGERLKDLEINAGLSYPTLVDINKGRIKKYHKSTLKILCDHFSTEDKQYSPDDILGLIEDKKENEEKP